ncbi:MAG: SDR family oxidoreductase [Pseudonocardiales bacterium]
MVLRFQQLMSKFLDTQQEVMTAYLGGADPPGRAAPVAPQPTTAMRPPVPAIPAPVQPAAETAPTRVDPTGNGVGPAPATPVPTPDAEQVARELVRLAADRTGYPPEMLDLDADLEADLGIDSIKRVEILGAAQQALSPSGDVLGEGMESLAVAKTLRALAEAIATTAGPPGPVTNGSAPVTNGMTAVTNGSAPAGVETAPAAADELPRFVATVLDAPLGGATLPLCGVVAITDDEQGIAAELAASLRWQGVEVALIRNCDDDRDRNSAGYAGKLGDAAATRALVESIHRQQGRICTLVHLLPLRAGPPFEELGIDGWRARFDAETRALLHLTQAVSADLRRPGTVKRLLAAIRLDGAFGHHSAGATSSPSNSGVTGVVKTLAREWPEVTCRVVDLDPSITDAAQRLVAELHADDDRVEVGWSGDRRITIGLALAPLPSLRPEPAPLDASPLVGPLSIGPLLADAIVTPVPDGIEITRMLDPEGDRYLDDHRLDGHPVLPAAAAMELMAEVAAAVRPGHEVTELRDMQVLRGVILDNGPRPVTVRAAATRSPGNGNGLNGNGNGNCVFDVTVLDSRTGRTSYRAEVVLRDALPTAPLHAARPTGALEPYPVPLERVYEELLFHGPLMRGITSIEGINDEAIVATLASSRPQQCLTRGEGRWIVDPVLIDSGFQLCVLWARARLDTTPLPTRIRRYRRFAEIPDGPVRCELRARVRAGGHLLDTQYAFRDTHGRLLAMIEEMEGACSRSLNRLAGTVATGAPTQLTPPGAVS